MTNSTHTMNDTQLRVKAISFAGAVGNRTPQDGTRYGDYVAILGTDEPKFNNRLCRNLPSDL
ncbi:MAG: hypothetical protein F6K21_18355 [Symploca sp. SIO2D2]|nr:hypothetical protein [Symploca sp. SIO2D2]